MSSELAYEEIVIKEIISNSNVKVLAEVGGADFFHNSYNNFIFKCVQKIDERGESISFDGIVTETNASSAKEDLKKKIFKKLDSLKKGVFLFHGKAVYELKRRHGKNMMIGLGSSLCSIGPEYTVDDGMRDIKGFLTDYMSILDIKSAVSYEKHMVEYMDAIKNGTTVKKDGIKFNRNSLRKLFGDISPGIYVIGGRPGMCKTMLADNIFVDLSCPESQGLYFTIENTLDGCCGSLASIESGVYGSAFRAGIFKEVQYDQLRKTIRKEDTRWVYAGVPSIEEIRRKTEYMIERNKNIKFIIIDYFQIIRRSHTKMSQVEEFEYWTSYLLQMWKDFGIAIFVLSQLNDRNEGKSGKSDHLRFQLGDLKGTGKLEEVADHVVGMEGVRKSWQRVTNIAKNRRGPLGSFEWRFDLPRGALTHEVVDDVAQVDTFATKYKTSPIVIEEGVFGSEPKLSIDNDPFADEEIVPGTEEKVVDY